LTDETGQYLLFDALANGQLPGFHQLLKTKIKQMKIRHYIGIMLLFIVAFQSCKKDETRAILASGESIKPATLSLDKTNVTLSKDNAEDTVLHLNMIQPDFGFQAAVTNVLQFGLKGDNFKTVKKLSFPTVGQALDLQAMN
jgi:hypothetical protein